MQLTGLRIVLLGSLLLTACSDPPPESVNFSRDATQSPQQPSDAAVTPNFDAQPRPFDASTNGADQYVPPVRPDAGELTAEEELSRCIQRMTNFINSTANTLECDQFAEAERQDRSSPYNLERRIAACIHLTCAGTQLEGHNGIPAARTCSELNDLVTVLNRAEEQAVEGGCQSPEFSLRIIDLNAFAGGEPCDQLTCGIDGEGVPITIDNRD